MNAHSTGIGGGGFMMIYDGKKKKAKIIDFRETAPHKAHKDLFHGDGEKGIRGKSTLYRIVLFKKLQAT